MLMMAETTRPLAAQRHRLLQIEQLEDRLLLAGNVAISVLSTTLGLTGDAAANDISVITEGGQLTLAGNGTTLSPGPGSAALLPFVVATDFNGTTATFVTLNNTFVNALATLPIVTVDFDMQGGNDTVSVETTTVGGNVVIDMGAGNDLLRMDQTTVGGDFTANFGDGADRAIATFNTWGDNLGPLEAINVNMGAGNDALAISNSSIAQGVQTISTGAGDDIVEYTDCVLYTFDVDLGTGDDQFIMEDTLIFNPYSPGGGFPHLLGGLGDDAVLLSHNSFDIQSEEDAFTVELGGGDDELVMVGNSVDSRKFEFYVDMGADNDYLATGGNMFFLGPAFSNDLPVEFDGGSGSDLLVALDSQPLDQFDPDIPFTLLGWELIDPDFPA